MSRIRLSALVVARDEADQLADCLSCLSFVDEVVVILDRCTDDSADVARNFTENVFEGEWPIEGDRRNTGIESCSGDWIIEVDADERVTATLGEEIRSTISSAQPGYFLVPFNNHIGGRLVRYGWGASWGVNSAPRLFSKGAKSWGSQRIHPCLELLGMPRRLVTPIEHHVDSDISSMILRLDRYSTERARDLRDGGELGSLAGNIRRFFWRFFKCYVRRKGYREGKWGFLIALMAGLYPLLSYLKARLEVK